MREVEADDALNRFRSGRDWGGDATLREPSREGRPRPDGGTRRCGTFAWTSVTDRPAPVPLDQLLVHREWVRALARTLVRDEHRADDVEQQTWLTAMEHPPRHATSLRAWLAAVVRTAARKARRSEFRRARHENGSPPRGASSPSGAELVAEAELQHGLVREVLDLEEPYRTTVLFRWFDGLPPREIAARMQVPVETVRTRLKRGHERLRERLDARTGGGRRAWSLLVLAWPEPSAPVPVGWPALPVAGVLAMAALKKTLGVAAVLALLAFAGWRLVEEVRDADEMAAPRRESAAAPEAVEWGDRARRARPHEEAPPAPTVSAAVLEGALEVTVRAPTGAPVSGARVETYLVETELHPDRGTDTDAQMRASPLPASFVSSGDDGRAAVRVERAGVPVVLRVTKPGFGAAVARVASGDAASPSSVDVLLVPGHALRGRVVTRDGRPVAGAAVFAGGLAQRRQRPPMLLARAVADEDGRFAFDALERGELLLWASPPGGVLLHVLTVRVPEIADAVVVLPNGAALRGVVRAAGGGPIEGASVGVAGSWNGERVATTARTDAEGRYRIEGFPPGTASLTVRADGHVGVPRPREPNVRAELREGAAVERDFELPRGCVLAGSVLGDGAPVAGATVTAADATPGGGTGPATTTDAQGRYRFDTLVSGRYVVVVSVDGWFQEGFGPHWSDVVRGGVAPEAATIDVPADAEARLDVHVARGRTISGRVLGADGRPVAGARVYGGYAETWSDGGPWRHGAARSAADGTFALRGVPDTREASVSAQVDGLGWAGTAVMLGPAGAEGVELRFADRAPAIVRGVARAADGARLDGAVVEWCTVDPDASAWQAQDAWGAATRAAIAADGSFEIRRDVPKGTVTLRVVAPGRAPASAVVCIVPEKRLYEVDVTVGRGRSVLGRVAGAGGAAVEGASVFLAPRDAKPRGNSWEPEPVRSLAATTSRAGEFVLRDLADGAYEVRVEARGMVAATRALDVPTSNSLDVELPPTKTLRGRARFEDGAPAADVAVSLTVDGDVQSWRSTRTDAAGTFAFEDLGEGPFSLSFGAWSLFSGDAPRDVVLRQVGGVRPATEPLDVVLERGARISGRVVDARGEGVANAFVECEPEGGASSGISAQMAVARADGAFEVFGLRPGGYVLRATGTVMGRNARFAYGPSEQRTAPAGTAGIALVVTDGRVIEGRLADPDGASLAGIRVVAHEVDAEGRLGLAHGNCDADASGRFRVGGLAEGRYRLVLQDALGRVTRLQIDDVALVAAGATGLRLPISARRTIRGTVRLPRGSDGASVRATRSGVAPSSSAAAVYAQTSFDGEFTVIGLEPGAAYDLRSHVTGHLPAFARNVAAGSDHVDLVPEAGVSASGRAVDRDGRAIANVLLAFTTEAADAPASAKTDAEGRFAVEGLAAAVEYRVRFETFTLQPDGTRKREWKDCGTIRAGDSGTVLRIVE